MNIGSLSKGHDARAEKYFYPRVEQRNTEQVFLKKVYFIIKFYL